MNYMQGVRDSGFHRRTSGQFYILHNRGYEASPTGALCGYGADP